MINYKPAELRPRMSQVPAVLPPVPDMLFTGYTGAMGFLETIFVLGATTAGALVGVRAGMTERDSFWKAAGWIGGIGSAVAGLLYLGTKSGLSQGSGLPAVRISPS